MEELLPYEVLKLWKKFFRMVSMKEVLPYDSYGISSFVIKKLCVRKNFFRRKLRKNFFRVLYMEELLPYV